MPGPGCTDPTQLLLFVLVPVPIRFGVFFSPEGGSRDVSGKEGGGGISGDEPQDRACQRESRSGLDFSFSQKNIFS